MIAVTKRAFGITLSLMMSVSMAEPAMAAATDASKENGKVHRASTTTGATASTRARTGTKTTTKTLASANRASHGRARTRDIPSYSGWSSDRNIRRASLSGHVDHSLIDDGTLWREDGHQSSTWQQVGMASWYGGKRWQGHATSSGSAFDENALTAAHATLPLGTKVRVVRHDGARSVIVTINDRPGTRTRIIDLSREAAKQLGILDAGVAMVTLQPM